MVEKAGFDVKNVTTHSGRKRMIQKLNGPSRSIPPTHICKSSGHKNVQSLNSILSERRQKKKFQHFEWIPGVLGPSSYQVGISNALTLNTSTQYSRLQHSSPFYTLKENPTLSLHSPKSKKHVILLLWYVSATFYFRIRFPSTRIMRIRLRIRIFLNPRSPEWKKKKCNESHDIAKSCPVPCRTIKQHGGTRCTPSFSGVPDTIGRVVDIIMIMIMIIKMTMIMITIMLFNKGSHITRC